VKKAIGGYIKGQREYKFRHYTFGPSNIATVRFWPPTFLAILTLMFFFMVI